LRFALALELVELGAVQVALREATLAVKVHCLPPPSYTLSAVVIPSQAV
jgi:hypothetical protein